MSYADLISGSSSKIVSESLGSQLLEDPGVVKCLLAYMLRKAYKASTSPSDFFEMVIREETTKRKVKVARHQRLAIDFVMAHRKSVLRLPVGHAKTFTMSALGMYLLGSDPTTRGAIVSNTQGQAEKPLAMVRNYIESSQELKLVFPDLRKSHRVSDPWTQTAITIERPIAIRDPSLVAVGFHGAIDGSRLNFILADDLLSLENTKTKALRDEMYNWFDGSVLSRLDPKRARVVVTNTAWHKDDLTHRLEKVGWPTMTMDIYGDIDITNTDWDSDLLRPASSDSLTCRLAGFSDSDLLFPERFTHDDVMELVRTHLPHRFNQLFRNRCSSSSESRCKPEWIEACKTKGKGLTMVSEYTGDYLTVTGVDLAVSESDSSHDTCFFTFAVLPTGERLILDIDVGKFDGPTIVEKMIDKHDRYRSFIRVENNAAQDFIRQFTLQRDRSLPIKPHRTGREKAHPELGVEGLFIEFSNHAWIIPCDFYGVCHPHIQRWIDACIFYSPNKHTDDVLMACYFGREEAKRLGVRTGSQTGLSADLNILAR